MRSCACGGHGDGSSSDPIEVWSRFLEGLVYMPDLSRADHVMTDMVRMSTHRGALVLKPYVVVVAALSALFVPLIGAQLAVAADTPGGWSAPVAKPQATSSPDSSASPSPDGDMAGMEGMPGMNHAKATTASQQSSSHAHSGEEATTGARPVVALVSGFAAINGGVLLLAAATRRRDKRGSVPSSRPARPAK